MSSNRIKHMTPREEALRQEIVSFLPRLRRFARSLARDPDRADDLVQAACQRALERLDQVREGTRLDSWLYRILYTRWVDKVRRGKTRTANLVVLAYKDAPVAAGGRAGNDLPSPRQGGLWYLWCRPCTPRCPAMVKAGESPALLCSALCGD